MWSRTVLVVVVVLLSISLPLTAWAGAHSAIIDVASATNTDASYATLADPDAQFSINDLLYHSKSYPWQARQGDVSRGVFAYPLWMKFTLGNSDAKQQRYLLEYTDPGPYQVDLYVVDRHGGIDQTYHYNREQPLSQKPYPNAGAVFPVDVPYGEQYTVYARITHKMGGVFSRFAIWHPAHFVQYESIETALYGGIYTSFFIFCFIALVIFFATKERSFLFYSGLTFTSAISLMHLDGHWTFLQFEHGVPVNHAVLWTGAYVFMALGFARSYLNLSEQLPWADKLVRNAMWLGLIIILLGLLDHIEVAGLLMMLSMLVILMVPFISVYLILAKQQKVRLFTLAWFIYGGAITIQFALRQVGIVPHLPITTYSGAIGAMIEMGLLTISMGFRVLDLKRERDQVRDAHVAHLEQFNTQLEAQVKAQTQALEQAKTKAEHDARTDPLTQLNNRRSFYELAPKLIKTMLRSQTSACAIAIDIDHFKQVNDNYGHDAGDLVLVQVTNVLAQNIRENDLLARLGGEEFSILALTQSPAHASDYAERVRAAVANGVIHLDNGLRLNVTVSIGVYLFNHDDSLSQVLNRADTALYRAKQNGRNQVHMWQPTAQLIHPSGHDS
ncbi:sensor domain-containing diguanylate cyclase [Motilimonas eburnea]|uniref:sensor domain-containing diguanylate cyclase n=1 Tax=Motilimonas eburnea TaxID=1737488 RepID=UPI001E4A5923|nr:diguanylate cyclase [Motilimonas eburnea]MCE2571156.1 sensor domain-containing diguanylate cyclase [Motilimonas eburnea]